MLRSLLRHRHTAIALRIGAALLVLYWLRGFFDWSIISATWQVTTPDECSKDGACWGYVGVWWDRFVYGAYPETLRWRVHSAVLIVCIFAVLIVVTRRKFGWRGGLLLGFTGWITAGIVLQGGTLGLERVDPDNWGGFLLTVAIAITAMLTSLAMGIPLAFMRVSKKRVISALARGYIEFWRAIPLITVLFLSVSLFPLFLPSSWEPERLYLVLGAFSLFYAAYMAEVVRGGLNALPSGQEEAAAALGLSKWRLRDKILIPQALGTSVPSIVNVLIAVIKDTTLVLIIGMTDLLGMVQQSLLTPQWGRQMIEGYLFVALAMWALCFSLSRVSATFERRN